MVLVLDDVGVDRIGVYAEHPDPGRTPNIDLLAREGVLFRNVWASPVCSSTRANALTGRYGFRTGVGDWIHGSSGIGGSGTDPGTGGGAGLGLPLEETILPEVLRHAPSGPYSSAALGKWHLGSDDDGLLHPLRSGFGYHAGSFSNIVDYFHWPKVVNGIEHHSDVYATTDTVDDAIRLTRALPEPWFLWVAFNAPHRPLHAPPDELHTFDLAGSPDQSAAQHMKAMTEALDTEIGRLLASMDPVDRAHTTIILLGDNGTEFAATTPPFSPGHAKGTLYEGGVNVPFIITGPRVQVPASECTALVNVTDVFATVAEIAGLDPVAVLPEDSRHDSISLLPYLADPAAPPRRDWVYAERFFPNGPGPYSQYSRAVRGPRYKLMHLEGLVGSADLFFDLGTDPFEQENLLLGVLSDGAQAELDRLQEVLDRLRVYD